MDIEWLPHQRAAISEMRAREEQRHCERREGIELQLYSKFGIYRDPIGSGKTATMLGLIVETLDTIPSTRVEMHMHPVFDCVRISKHPLPKNFVNATLVSISEHGKIWRTELKRTKLHACEVTGLEDIDPRDYDVVIVPHTFLDTIQHCYRVCWRRVIIDDPPQERLSLPPRLFTWWIDVFDRHGLFEGMSPDSMDQLSVYGDHAEILKSIKARFNIPEFIEERISDCVCICNYKLPGKATLYSIMTDPRADKMAVRPMLRCFECHKYATAFYTFSCCRACYCEGCYNEFALTTPRCLACPEYRIVDDKPRPCIRIDTRYMTYSPVEYRQNNTESKLYEFEAHRVERMLDKYFIGRALFATLTPRPASRVLKRLGISASSDKKTWESIEAARIQVACLSGPFNGVDAYYLDAVFISTDYPEHADAIACAQRIGRTRPLRVFYID